MIYADLSEEERALLRDAYEAGFAAGNGRPTLGVGDPELINAVADDWWDSLETMQACAEPRGAEGLPPVPAWLMELDAAPSETYPQPDLWFLNRTPTSAD